MTASTSQVFALLNLALCAVIFWACICRLNTDTCKRHLRARARYVLLLAGAMASGAQPLLFNTLPGPGETIFAASVLAGLLINLRRWVHTYGGKCCKEDDQ